MRSNGRALPAEPGEAPAATVTQLRADGGTGRPQAPPRAPRRVDRVLRRVPPQGRLPLLTYVVCQLILLFWWAAFYPGLMNADSINFVLHVTTGPWINNASVLYDCLVWVSLHITGDLGLLSLAQCVAMAAALGYAVYAFRLIGVPGRWTAIASVVVVALPAQGSFITFLWKDVPFSICAFLVVPTLAHLFSLRGLPEWPRGRRVNRLLAALFLELLGVCLFRQDGMEIVLVAVALMVILIAGLRKKLAAIGAATVLITLVLDLAVFPAVGIVHPSSSLLFGPSDADIAVVYHDSPASFSKADLALMKRIVPLREWRYGGADCYSANQTTFLHGFDAHSSRHAIQLFRLWLQLVKRVPQDIISARLCRGALAWVIQPNSQGRTFDYDSFTPANLWGWANVPAVKYNPYRADFATRPLTHLGNDAAQWLRDATEVPQLDWLLWRGSTWTWFGYIAIGLFALRRRDKMMLALAAILAGQQFMVLADNPVQLFRYMMTPLLIGPLLIPLLCARNRRPPDLAAVPGQVAGAGCGSVPAMRAAPADGTAPGSEPAQGSESVPAMRTAPGEPVHSTSNASAGSGSAGNASAGSASAGHGSAGHGSAAPSGDEPVAP